MKKMARIMMPLMVTALSAPVAAQDSVAPTVEATAPAPTAPEPAAAAAAGSDATADAQADAADAAERTAAATRIVDITLPVGSFAQIWAAMPGQTDPTLTEDIAERDKETRRAAHEARTGRPVTGTTIEADESPVAGVMGRIADLMEPLLRNAITRVYARRYSLAQLRELEAFFQTPTGASFARDSLTMMTQPEVLTAMQEASEDMIGIFASEIGAEAMLSAAKTE